MTIKLLRGLGLFALAGGALCAGAAAQTAPEQPAASNPICVRLEAQLAMINRGAVDPARADQIKRYEDAVAKQQADLDRILAQSKKQGCEGGGFFALFTGRSPQCGPLDSQIQQMRDNLDRTMTDLEYLKSGHNDQDGQRRALIGQLAQNNCGAQYHAAAAAAGPGSFLDALFGGGTIINPGGDGAPSGTYRTVCVRTCDGYYFPISYSTVPTASPTTSALASACAPPPKRCSTAIAIRARTSTRRCRSTVSRIPSCRVPFTIAKTSSPAVLAAGRVRAGPMRSRTPRLNHARERRYRRDRSEGESPLASAAAGAAGQAAGQRRRREPPDPSAPPAAADTSAPDANASPRTVRTVGPPFVSAHRPR